MTAKKIHEGMNSSKPFAKTEACVGEFDEERYDHKLKVECICPKCGKMHLMALHWIGRGVPRKYCSSCRGRQWDD